MKVYWVYMTAGSMEEAEKVGKALLEERLAACVNIMDNMRSMYVWKGEVRDDREVVVIAKTTENRLPDLIGKVESVHSYEVPCIVALPVEGGHTPFLDWVKGEVGV